MGCSMGPPATSPFGRRYHLAGTNPQTSCHLTPMLAAWEVTMPGSNLRFDSGQYSYGTHAVVVESIARSAVSKFSTT